MSGPSRGIVAGDRTPYDKYIPKDFLTNRDKYRKGPKIPPVIDSKQPSQEDMERIKAKKDYYGSRARNETPPMMRTMDFQDKNMNGIDDRDEKKKNTGRQPAPRTEKDPRNRNRGGMPSREELQRIADAFSGKARTGGRRRRGGIFDRLRNQARRRTESPYEPKMPGGGRLRPPVMGPDPDIGRMMPRRFEGLGATLVDALGIKSKGMGDKKRSEPPRPSPKRGGVARQRRR